MYTVRIIICLQLTAPSELDTSVLSFLLFQSYQNFITTKFQKIIKIEFKSLKLYKN